MENLSTISNLYRFALVLTNNASQAQLLVEEAVRELLHKGGVDSTRRMRLLIFRKVWQRIQSQERPQEQKSASEVIEALHVLAEPSRSAMVLLCLECFSLQDLESFLDLSVQKLAEALEAARAHLRTELRQDLSCPQLQTGFPPSPTSGKLKQVRNFLLVCPPTRSDWGDARLKKALSEAEKNPELQAFLDGQLRFDRYIGASLKAISLPAVLHADAIQVESRLSHQAMPALSLRDPAIVSVIVASMLLVGLAIWLFFGRWSSVPGSSEAWRVISEGDSAAGDRLEPISLKMDVLDDWFAMKGMDQFWAPSTLGNLDIIAGRVFTVADVPVAMGVVDSPRMSFYAFNGSRLGISPPADGRWKIFTREHKAIGIIRQGDAVFLIEIEGNQEDLQQILHRFARA